ncbi:cytochrome c oxidase assembly protein [Amnibacterium endophyticum]|uniref:Cytochrome c oxidase assembly protein n=1 Tax=Amnibacterium endophyticum TaxID=2109337 RepID=A0ABW4LA70_9MICO
MSGWMWMPSAPPTLAALLAVHLQPVPVLPVVAALLGVLYATGVLRLRARGDAWPVTRSLWFAAGLLVWLAVTATGVEGYGMELFSVHMVQHMVLGMLVPILLVLGAPMTLLLRALPGRSPVRKGVLAVVHSRPVRVLTHPVVVSAIFFVSLYGLYFTPVFDALMRTMWGHNLMLLHFIAVGGLYFWGILRVDPTPRHSDRGIGVVGEEAVPVLELGAGVPFHAFFGVALMLSPVLLATVYAHPMASWGVSPLGDQQAAGGIAWGATELPTLLVLAVLFAQWQRSDARRAARSSRGAGLRREEEELAAYNARLAAIADHDARA